MSAAAFAEYYHCSRDSPKKKSISSQRCYSFMVSVTNKKGGMAVQTDTAYSGDGWIDYYHA